MFTPAAADPQTEPCAVRLLPASAPIRYPPRMKRVLLTGMSGTGKSTLVRALAARGYTAVDTDSDEWCEWVDVGVGAERAGMAAGPNWVWRADRIGHLWRPKTPPCCSSAGASRTRASSTSSSTASSCSARRRRC